MNLQELRNNLEGDAQKRCRAQEQTIKDLIQRNKDLTALLDEQYDDIRALQNRCMAYSHGLTCFFCTMRSRCKGGGGSK